MLHATFGTLAHARSWSAVPEIVFINLLLSGDNAVVIAMACRALPRRQRLFGLVIGEGLAVVLLIIFAAAMARLLQLPYLKLAGGVALLYIAVRLLLPDATGSEPEAVTRFWRAVRIVAVADLIMSFDNVLAIVQIAGGDLVLLALGLAVSIPVVVAGAALITALLDKLPLLVWAGSVLLGWVAGQSIVGDQAVASLLSRAVGGKYAAIVDLAGGCAGAVLVMVVGGFWRRRRMSRMRSPAPPDVPRE